MSDIRHLLGQARDSLDKGKASISREAGMEQGIFLDHGFLEGTYGNDATDDWNTTFPEEIILEEGKFHFLPLDGIDGANQQDFRPWETNLRDIFKVEFQETPLGWVSPFD